jgi:hypothetical protein
MYLISGCFFHESSTLDYVESKDGDVKISRQKKVLRTMFVGFFSENGSAIQKGEVVDEDGRKSYLMAVHLQSKKMSLTKVYESDPRRIIEHQFTKNVRGNGWTGYYRSKGIRRGEVHCVLTFVDDNFFVPRSGELATPRVRIVMPGFRRYGCGQKPLNF